MSWALPERDADDERNGGEKRRERMRLDCGEVVRQETRGQLRQGHRGLHPRSTMTSMCRGGRATPYGNPACRDGRQASGCDNPACRAQAARPARRLAAAARRAS